jgi:Circadian oscillating protein COP23
MSFKKFASLTLSLTLLGGSVTINNNSTTAREIERGNARFSCGTYSGKKQEYRGKPATIATLESDNKRVNIAFVIWTKEFNSNWPPEERCRQVSTKFQLNQEDGRLRYIIPGTANNLPVLCASNRIYRTIIKCNDRQILLTLRSTEYPIEMVRKLYELRDPRDPKDALILRKPSFECDSSFKNNENECPSNVVQGLRVNEMIKRIGALDPNLEDRNNEENFLNRAKPEWNTPLTPVETLN